MNDKGVLGYPILRQAKRCVLFIAGAKKRWTPSSKSMDQRKNHGKLEDHDRRGDNEMSHDGRPSTSISEMDMPIRLGFRRSCTWREKTGKQSLPLFLNQTIDLSNLSLSHSHYHSHSISLSLSLSYIISGQWGHFNTTHTYELGFRMHLDTYVYVYNHWEDD